MMRHAVKSSFGQCQCHWCGSRRGADDCPVTDSIRGRVAAFAAEHGRTWRAKLRSLWNSGKDDGLLRQARNIIGPNNLDRITPFMLKAAAKVAAERADAESEEDFRRVRSSRDVEE